MSHCPCLAQISGTSAAPSFPTAPSSSTCSRLKQMQSRLRARQRGFVGMFSHPLFESYLPYKDTGDTRVHLLLGRPQPKGRRQSFGINQKRPKEKEHDIASPKNVLSTQVSGPAARAAPENGLHGPDHPSERQHHQTVA